jgi:hypothetical protein
MVATKATAQPGKRIGKHGGNRSGHHSKAPARSVEPAVKPRARTRSAEGKKVIGSRKRQVRRTIYIVRRATRCLEEGTRQIRVDRSHRVSHPMLPFRCTCGHNGLVGSGSELHRFADSSVVIVSRRRLGSFDFHQSAAHLCHEDGLHITSGPSALVRRFPALALAKGRATNAFRPTSPARIVAAPRA